MEQRLASRDLSVDVPIGEGDEATLLNFLPDDKRNPRKRSPTRSTAKCSREKMARVRQDVSRTRRSVIFRREMLTEEPRTLREIGEKYGISRERVRQIEERVKKKLKAYLRKELKDFAEVAGAG